MILTAYPQATDTRTIQLWVGVFGAEQPPGLVFTLDGIEVQPEVAAALGTIRDLAGTSAAQPINHRGVFRFRNLVPAAPYRIVIRAAGTPPLELLVRTLPEPDLTLLAGDQVYCDLPLSEDLPEHDPKLSRRLGDKYRRNWASASLGVPGLEAVLRRAPVVCLPDDHEYWNNYPFPQKQLPGTWTAERRARWETASRNLYQDYQRPEGSEGAVRIDIAPLKFRFLDTRSSRAADFETLMAAPALPALQGWLDDLLAVHRQREVGVRQPQGHLHRQRRLDQRRAGRHRRTRRHAGGNDTGGAARRLRLAGLPAARGAIASAQRHAALVLVGIDPDRARQGRHRQGACDPRAADAAGSC
ncbi:MAG: alkaline phosphatase D family protein [Nevskia sp.]|nr:alkaline phosphatase D family protein [Nevskia sp.]